MNFMYIYYAVLISLAFFMSIFFAVFLYVMRGHKKDIENKLNTKLTIKEYFLLDEKILPYKVDIFKKALEDIRKNNER